MAGVPAQTKPYVLVRAWIRRLSDSSPIWWFSPTFSTQLKPWGGPFDTPAALRFDSCAGPQESHRRGLSRVGL